MDIQNAKNAAAHIAVNGVISEADAHKIIKLLKTKDLVKFSRILKSAHAKQTVEVTSADEIDRETNTKLKALFGDKQINKTVNGKIGAGIRVQVYDMIYDLSVKSQIRKLAQIAQEEI